MALRDGGGPGAHAPGDAFQDDLALVTQATSGDTAARRALATRLIRRAWRTVRALVPVEADARDLLQESLVEVLKNARTYRGHAPLEGWADRIVVRRVMRWFRSSRKARDRRDRLDVPEAVSDPLPPARLLAEGLARPVEEYLAELSEPLRTTLILRHALGHSIPEIASITGATPKRVQKRIARAVARLRAAIAAEERSP
jgi:RNA polymerase sigma-70 factor (ECF subfamily)